MLENKWLSSSYTLAQTRSHATALPQLVIPLSINLWFWRCGFVSDFH